MLKKVKDGRGGGNGGNGQAEMRLFKVLDVKKDGIVSEFVDGKAGPEKVFMEAMPGFVKMKMESPNFRIKGPSDKIPDMFYEALMIPTQNKELRFKKDKDIISAKIFQRQGTKTVEEFGDLPKVGLGGGFTIFARGDSVKTDDFDPTPKEVPADTILKGMGRIVTDDQAENKATNKKGATWLEVLTERGNPSDLEALFDEIRILVKSTRGKRIYLRFVDQEGQTEATGSFFPGKDLQEVEDEIQEIKDMNLPLSQIFVWDIQPRIYLRDDFMTSQGKSPSKLDRFRRDAEFIYNIKADATPYEVGCRDLTRGGTTQRIPEDGYFIPIAVSQTMYANPKDATEWLPGAIRAMVPIGSETLHSKQAYMTPQQRKVANEVAPEAVMEDAPQAPDVQSGMAPRGPAPAPEKDLDFNFEADEAFE